MTNLVALEYDVVRVHAGDGLVRHSILRVLNRYHDKRIRQDILDFYRRDYVSFNSKDKDGGEVIFLIAIAQNMPIGISCCTVSRKSKTSRSITVVSDDYRRYGVGSKLLRAKLNILEHLYDTNLKTFVSKTNEASIGLCMSAGLPIIGEGQRERDGKEPTEYYIFNSCK